MSVIQAHFDGVVLVPDEPVDLPKDAPLEVYVRRSTDPFVRAKPIVDVTVLRGGLPDDRDAEEILADIRASRLPRNRE